MKTEVKHTAGPWRYSGPCANERDKGELHFAVHWPDCGTAAHVFSEGDARLIAAAPELLDSLREALREGHYWHGDECKAKDSAKQCDCWVSRAEAAIAKATGEPNESQ